MRERWAEEITARAAAQWPEQRQRTLLGGKNLMLPIVEAAPLLRVLGLLTRDGDMSRDGLRKYMQVNHMVSLLAPVVRDLMATHSVVRILDVACGKSYLNLLLAWCFRHRWHHPFRILGVDSDAGVVGKSRERAEKALLEESLRFEVASIRSLDTAAVWNAAFDEEVGVGDIHAVVALHACDTATDEALALGVRLRADFIGAVPCCQAELARGWATLAEEARPGAFAPIWASNHLRREAAATMTDALRTLLLRARGYDVTAMEFVSSEHTPKNTLLRAQRGEGDRERADREYRELKHALGGVSIRLEELLAAD